MEINKSVDSITTTLEIIGELNITTTPMLEEQLGLVKTEKLVLDFSGVSYITSAALRLLLVQRKKLGNTNFKCINVNPDVEHIFKMTGFDTMLSYETSNKKAEIDYSKHSFVTLLKRNVEESGNDDAYVFLRKHYTWSDIDVGSQILADKLAKLGVKQGSHVAIDSPNTINWILAFYAIQKLGAIAILVNFSLKPLEVAGLAETADITHICFGGLPGKTDFASFTEALKQVSPIIKEAINISVDVDFFAEKENYNLIIDKYNETFNPDDASVVIFTSGSTGRPKAVLNSAYNCIINVKNAIEEFDFKKADYNLAFLPNFHVFGLAVNVTIAVLAQYPSFIPHMIKPDFLIDVIDKEKITNFCTVPTMMLALLQAPNFSKEKVSSLRLSMLGGSATTEPQMKMLKELMPNNHLCNVYGMSENPLISITRYEDTIEHTTKTVGKPLGDIKIEIRSPEGKPLPQGESGEICIKCDSMIICYYKLAVDEQSFDDRGFMSTGDLGYIDEQGYIRLVGRAKDLIIRGGENISPVEIASEISKLDYVSDVKVLGVPHELLGEEVAAALILKAGASFDKKQIVDYLSTKLAKYKVPAHFIIYDKFPLLGSGKLDAISLKKDVIRRIKEENL